MPDSIEIIITIITPVIFGAKTQAVLIAKGLLLLDSRLFQGEKLIPQLGLVAKISAYPLQYTGIGFHSEC